MSKQENKKYPRPLIEEDAGVDPTTTAQPVETGLPVDNALLACLREQLGPVREEMRLFREEVRQCEEAVVSIGRGFREQAPSID